MRPDGEPRSGETVIGPGTVSVQPEGLPVTAMNWLVAPDSIRELMTRVVAPVTGALPVYITENGSAWHDYVTQDGQVHDLRADRLPARPPGRAARRDRGRRASGVLRLVAAR